MANSTRLSFWAESLAFNTTAVAMATLGVTLSSHFACDPIKRGRPIDMR